MTVNMQTFDEFVMPTPKGLTLFWESARKTIHEEGIIDFVSKLSPWIAPLPSAWFVHDATVRHLAAGSALAWIIHEGPWRRGSGVARAAGRSA